MVFEVVSAVLVLSLAARVVRHGFALLFGSRLFPFAGALHIARFLLGAFLLQLLVALGFLCLHVVEDLLLLLFLHGLTCSGGGVLQQPRDVELGVGNNRSNQQREQITGFHGCVPFEDSGFLVEAVSSTGASGDYGDAQCITQPLVVLHGEDLSRAASGDRVNRVCRVGDFVQS